MRKSSKYPWGQFVKKFSQFVSVVQLAIANKYIYICEMLYYIKIVNLIGLVFVFISPEHFVHSSIIQIIEKSHGEGLRTSESQIQFLVPAFSFFCGRRYLISTVIYVRFYELLEGVAQICERECGLLPPNVSPDCAIQLTYVVQVYLL